MKRYEFSEGGSNKFWEITLDGRSYRVRFGKIGSDGQTTLKEFDSEEAAQAAYDKIVAEKVKKGYRLIAGTDPKPAAKSDDPGKELGERLEANPDDEAAYLVLADWLQSKGNPRGELIMLHHAGNQAAAEELIAKHELLGRFASFVSGEERSSRRRRFDVTWRLGFVKSLSIGWRPFEDEQNTAGIAADDVGEIFGLPSFRFLRELEVGPVPSDEIMTPDAVIEAVCEHAPLSLRAITMCNRGAWDMSQSQSGDFGIVAETFAKLERVTLHGGGIAIAEVDLPELRELNIETGGFSKSDIAKLLRCRFPKLETLRVWFGDPEFGGNGSAQDLRALLAGDLFPNVEHLGLMNCAFADELVDALVESKILKKLTHLDLSMGNLSDIGVETMLDSEDMLSHLEWLNLDDSALTDKHRKDVLALAKSVTFGKEQDPDRVGENAYRYVSVGE